MTRKTLLPALSALAALAFAALPAFASAATPTFDPTGGKFPVSFTGSASTASTLKAGSLTVTCKTADNSGKFTSGTTGEIEISFTNCSTFSGSVTCTSPGSASGTITTGTSVFHLIYTDSAHKKAGVLITPPAGGTYATFTCLGVTTTVTGNGIIGTVTAPGFNTVSSNFTVAFTCTNSIQDHRFVEETGTNFHLLAATGGGSAVEACEETTQVQKLSGTETGKLTNT